MGRTVTFVFSRGKPARQHEAEQAPVGRSANCKKSSIRGQKLVCQAHEWR